MLITADLHYDIARSRRPTEELARRVCAQQADALVLAGDTGGADLSVLQACLALFKEFTGRKLLVLGNHCLWCRGRENSLDRYERLVPQAAAAAGFGVLDHRPAVLGRVLLAAPKVTRVYCGHSHWKSTHKIRHLTVVNVGSTYTQKHLEVLDL